MMEQKVVKIVEDLMNTIYNIDPTLSVEKAIEFAIFTCMEVRNVIPMYTGNLNPKWELWENVRLELQKRKLAQRK